jgi:hypothetical protein
LPRQAAERILIEPEAQMSAAYLERKVLRGVEIVIERYGVGGVGESDKEKPTFSTSGVIATVLSRVSLQ